MPEPAVVVWVNRSAGGGRGAKALPRVTSALANAGRRVVVVDEPDISHGRDLVGRQLADGAGLLIAVGGDGTVHQAIQCVATTDVPLGIVAVGSGDDIARAAGVPRHDPDLAVARILADATHTMDLGVCTPALTPLANDGAGPRTVDGSADPVWFGATLYAGFDARVNARANRIRGPWGPAKYPVSAVAEIAALSSRTYALDLDGQLHRLEAVAVVVANAPTYGGGMRIAPDADPRDGVLDLTLVGRVRRRTLLRVLPTVYSGRHVKHPAVTTMTARRVRMDSPGGFAYADGERVGPLPLDIAIVPGALVVAGGVAH